MNIFSIRLVKKRGVYQIVNLLLWTKLLLALAMLPMSLCLRISSPVRPMQRRRALHSANQWRMSTVENQNVEQTKDTSRDKVMTFSYDMSLEPKYDKPTYPGTGNGLGGEDGEYDVRW
mgnify:CR=1 FL=1